ncbi:MAG: hypothetical protein ACR5LD_03640 [Symbiopectobacterium sp.]
MRRSSPWIASSATGLIAKIRDLLKQRQIAAIIAAISHEEAFPSQIMCVII